MTIRVVSYYTKGLADIALSEIAALASGASVVEHTDRFAVISLPEADLKVLRERARTIDDIRALVGGPADIHSPHDLTSLCQEAASATEKLIEHDGRATTDPWSVTVSARNPAWRQGEEWSPAATIAEHLHGAATDATSRRPVDLRLQVDEERAHLAVNFAAGAKVLGDGPSRSGALRPTVAAAMVRLALDAVPAATARLGMYDPFCGSGTIVAEAALAGLSMFGSDIDEQAVQLTRQRLTAMGRDRQVKIDPDSLGHRVFVHDVAKGFPPRVTARIIVGNMPWGKQIKIDRHQELFDATCQLVAKAVDAGGCAVLLTTNEDRFVARLRKQVKKADITATRIGLLGQTPAIVRVKQSGGKQ